MIRVLYFLALGLSCTNVAVGQCVDRDSLWNHLQSIQNGTQSPSQQLPLLLKYAELTKNCSYRNDSTHALLLRTIADLEYKSGEYLSAIRYYRASINTTTSYPGKAAVHPRDFIRTYYLLSNVYESLNDIPSMMASLDSSSAIAMRLNAVDGVCLWALYSRVQYYFNVGDYTRCIEYANMCERRARELADREPTQNVMRYISSSIHWHVNALLAQGKFQLAESLLIERLQENLRTGLRINQGTLYEQLAEVQVEKGDYGNSLYSFNQAYLHETKRKNQIGLKTILNNIGYFIYHRNKRNLDSAIFYYQRALEIKNINQAPDLEAIENLNILNNIAGAYVLKSQFVSANKYFQRAFDQIKPGINENEVAKYSSVELSRQRKIRYVTSLVIEKGAAYQEQYRATRNESALNEAIRIYKLADRFLDNVKTVQFDTESKLFWRSDSRRLYELAIDACHSSGRIADAFYFFEKSRAVLLHDQLNEQRWLGSEDIYKQTVIKRKILQLERRIDTTQKNSVQYRQLQNELFFSRKELDSLVEVIKQSNPLYFQNYIDTSIISLEDVQRKVLKDYQGLVETFTGDSAVFALILTPQKNQLIKIEKREFDEQVRSYMGYISDPVLLNRNYNAFINTSNRLYRLIFQNSILPAGRIIISPDGNYFPFEALLIDSANASAYFVTKYAVSYTYSVRYLFNQFNKKKYASPGTFIGVAPIRYPGNFNLVSLTGSDGSLQRVKDYYSASTTLIGQEASKNNFLQKFAGYRIIHLYTHAVDSGSNGEPVIYFADSTLLLSDLIYEKETNSQLIVLSACKTGRGKLRQGEGVFSFNRGFAAAGIPTSIVNLWSVEDQATYKLTELFYKYLSKGYTTDNALQKAKLEFISSASNENKLPYFWASSIVVGINDTITENKWLDWKIILLGTMVIGLVVFIVLRKSRRKK